MYKIKKIVKGFKPLASGAGKIILCRGNRIYTSDLNLSNIQFLCKVPTSSFVGVMSKIRIFDRIFRLSINSFIFVDENHGLAVRKGEIWRVDLLTADITLDFVIPQGRRALNLTILKNIDGANSSIVFGEYFNNPEKKAVNIWQSKIGNSGSWSIAHTFSAGEINHVHSIFQDETSRKSVVFCGDFEDAAGMWSTNDNFKSLIPILRGSQQYRATWAHRLASGLYYATDTQLENNYLCRLSTSEGEVTSISVSKTEGSSIYYGVNRQGLFFSTAVEPGEPTGNLWMDIFCMKRGKGIASNNSIIYFVDKNGAIEKVFESRKDFIPSRLGQFGTFVFPTGVMNTEDLVVYGVAVRSFDNCCLLLSKY